MGNVIDKIKLAAAFSSGIISKVNRGLSINKKCNAEEFQSIMNYLYYWSSLRYNDSPKRLTEKDKLTISPVLLNYNKHYENQSFILTLIKNLAARIYSKFEYTPDDFTKLYDAIDSPAALYLKYLNNPPIKDDCDGFASALYCPLSVTEIGCRLLIYGGESGCHAMVLIKLYSGIYYMFDYEKLVVSMDNIPDLLYVYGRRNHNKLRYYDLAKWDEILGSWRSSKDF